MLYTPAYVDSIKDPVLAALDIYKLYATAPGMQSDTDVTFEKYVPLDLAKALAYVIDAQNFYGFGPGIAGQDFSYRAAKPILDDFFDELDKRIKGGSTAAVFRPAHGETTMPFAALLQLPGSEKQAAKGEVYTYDNNPWRGSVAGRLAGNVEWVAYRNAAKDVLVTMRYNEQPVEVPRRLQGGRSRTSTKSPSSNAASADISHSDSGAQPPADSGSEHRGRETRDGCERLRHAWSVASGVRQAHVPTQRGRLTEHGSGSRGRPRTPLARVRREREVR